MYETVHIYDTVHDTVHVAMSDDMAAFDWTNDVALTTYMEFIDELALTDDVSRSYWTKMII